jgi:hypothetical protein
LSGAALRQPLGRRWTNELLRKAEKVRANAAGARTFWILASWLLVVFLIGGASRADVQSLVILRPLSAFVLGYAICTVSVEQLREYRWLLVLAVCAVLLPLLQLVPFPPSLWHGLPGRSLIVEVDSAAGLNDIWRPLTLTPAATRNAVWSLMVPLSVLALGIQLSNLHLRALLPVVLAIGYASALLGIMQMASDPQGPLYFYRVTHNGSAVGLFANRNHQAVLLAALVPTVIACVLIYRPGKGLPGVWGRSAAPVMAVASIAVILPLVLVTGSRAGMLAGILAIIVSPLLLTGLRPGAPCDDAAAATSVNFAKARAPWLIAAGALALVLLTVFLGRAVAFERLIGTDPDAEMRIRMIPTVLSMIREYWPWGSGFGSFPAVYQIHEPDALLAPQYMNQAHNDWLDIPLSGGLPAATLLLAALLALIATARLRMSAGRAGRHNALMARLGLLILALLGLGSISDYPLRVPSLACLAVIATLWATAKVPPLPDRNFRYV